MNVRVDEAGACRRIVHVDVPAEGVAEDYRRVLSAYARAAKLRGFRKGRAPEDVVERHFGAQIAEEARDQAVPRLSRDALRQAGVDPVSVVEVKDVAFDPKRGIRFRLVVDVAPSFEIPNYEKIALNRHETAVTDEQVDSAIESLRERSARYEEVAGREVRAGDLVTIDYAGTCGGQPVRDLGAECAELGDGRDFSALVGEPEFLPGFARGMAGALAGQTVELAVHFPDQYRLEPLRGRDANYRITVKGIREKRLPDLDEAFLKRFGAGSESELRARLRQEMQRAADGAENARLKDEIAKYLLAAVRCEIPQSVLAHETGVTARNMVQRIAAQGVAREQIEARQDEIVRAAHSSSEDRIRLGFILERIAEKESVSVTDEDVDKRIESLAEAQGTSAARLRAELDRRNAMGRVRDDVRAGKVLDLLLERAKVN